jgi:hypothetical protein
MKPPTETGPLSLQGSSVNYVFTATSYELLVRRKSKAEKQGPGFDGAESLGWISKIPRNLL